MKLVSLFFTHGSGTHQVPFPTYRKWKFMRDAVDSRRAVNITQHHSPCVKKVVDENRGKSELSIAGNTTCYRLKADFPKRKNLVVFALY